MTIEERADRIIYHTEDGSSLTRREVIAYAKGYELGATEQKAIDIDKACEWFANYLFKIGYPDDWERDSVNMISGSARFRKAMEEDI